MLTVADIMSTEVFFLHDTDNLALARSLMKLARIRHIPIVDSMENFIGIVTHRDILAATISKLAEIDPGTQREIDTNIPIHEIMRTDVRTVEPTIKLRDAAEILLLHKYGCLPVVEGSKLVGIITEADFLHLTINILDGL